MHEVRARHESLIGEDKTRYDELLQEKAELMTENQEAREYYECMANERAMRRDLSLFPFFFFFLNFICHWC
jgi:hypothetical protein